MENEGREFGWEDEIKNDSEFTLLPEGDYSFTVDRFERGRSSGEGKLPACNMATVYFNVTDGSGASAQIRENFILHSSLEWKLSQLFTSVGLKKKGEPLKMNWQALIGRTGRCNVVQVPGFKDPTQKYNSIKTLYPAEGKNYTAGQF